MMKRASLLDRVSKGFSRLFFCWTLPLFWKGLDRDLSQEDLGSPHSSDFSDALADELENNWFDEISRTEPTKKKPSLLKTLTRTYICHYILDGVLILIQYVLFKSFQPLLLAMLLSFFTGSCSKEHALYYAAGLTLVSTGNVFIQHHTVFRQQRLGMRIRIACCSLIYRKLLRLSSFSLTKITSGQVINLLSNDVNRFDPVLKFLHILWVVPIQILVCCYLYYHKVSSLALLGVIFILVQTIPLQTYFSRLAAKLRLEIAQRTDERVRLIDEIICAIHVIKMYAWEKPFEEAVKEIRRKELASVSKQAFLRAITSSFIIFTERSSLYLVLLGHVLLRYPIDAPTVYSLAQFYNMLQNMLASVYPNAVTTSVECCVSIRRIQEFLLLEERPQAAIMAPPPPSAKNIDKIYGIDNIAFEHPGKFMIPVWDEKVNQIPTQRISAENDNVAVELMGVRASWDSSGVNHLRDLFLRVPPGKLCVVIGHVGAGKSSLLQLLLKELPQNNGVVSVNGEVSYASQVPWLFVSTIRNNILFGQPYLPKRYRAVVHVCALEQDFQQFPRGDQTLVGERGVSLSGGQRARINLARAVYRQADIYLLDDPLSCVDAPVGSHLFHACIKDYLRGKTRILVTHQLHYLKSADMIILMDNGRICKIGTFEELKRSDQDFTGLLDTNNTTNSIKGSKEDLTALSSAKSVKEMSRRISVASTGKTEFEEKEQTDAQEEEGEAQVSGRMRASVFWKYWRAGKSPWLLVFMVLTILLGQLTASATDYWVTYWTNQHSQKHQIIIKQIKDIFLTAADGNMEISYGILNYERIPKSNRSRLASFLKSHNITGSLLHNYTREKNESLSDELHRYVGPFTTLEYVYIYSILIGSVVILAVTGSSLFFKACIRSSGGLHQQVFSRILRAKMQFFDKNPSGRILNRFSKDMGVIDEWMPKDMMEAVQIMMFITSALVMVSITNTWLLIPTFVVLVLFYFLISMYLSTAQDIKRLEGITRSPVFSHSIATLQGISTIRSANAQVRQIKEFDARQDVHTAAWVQFLASRSTLGFWLDITCVMFVTCVTLTFIIFKDESVLSGHVGLAISQALFLTTTLQFGVRQLTEVIAHLTSAERMQQYLNVDVEEHLEKGEKITPKNWPYDGNVAFKHVYLSYNDNDKPVLENLNVHIQSGWKVGIVGRTGAGKSSMISALFRLAKVDGGVYVDDVDLGTIALQDLRSSISIIPQEPVLFSATMRYNLDPFGIHSDDELWNALEEADIKDSVPSLDFQVQEGGSNLSVGQKQLICLARVILRNNKILVLDEATASVDQQTDGFIQEVIRKHFNSCTVLTIAHRLHTVMDSDRVIVMDQGKIVEFGTPWELLKRKDSILHHMVYESGADIATALITLAEDCYRNRNIIECVSNTRDKIDTHTNIHFGMVQKNL